VAPYRDIFCRFCCMSCLFNDALNIDTVQHLAEWKWSGETEIFAQNLTQCHFCIADLT
jgi:hypothetical protein